LSALAENRLAPGAEVRDNDPAGGSKTLVRSVGVRYAQVSLTTALGRTTNYKSERGVFDAQQMMAGDRKTVTFPDETQNVLIKGLGEHDLLALADGTELETTRGRDPRFGMEAPIVTEHIVRVPPYGKTMSFTRERTATFADPDDPQSMLTLKDTVRRAGHDEELTAEAEYDRLTNSWAFKSPEDRHAALTLDTLGRPLVSSTEGLEPVSRSYDLRGRLSQLAVGTGQAQRVTTFVYYLDSDPDQSRRGRLQKVVDALGRETSFTYDLVGRVLTQTLPDSRVITFQYDDNGNVTSIQPPGRDAHVHGYNALDLLASYLPPQVVPPLPNRTTSYQYNLDHQPTVVTRPDGAIIVFNYDNTRGSLMAMNADGEIFTYLPVPNTGKLYRIVGPTARGTLTYTYEGMLTTSEALDLPEFEGTVSWAFDPEDLELASQTVNGRTPIGFEFDEDGLLVRAGDLTIQRKATNGIIEGTTLGLSTTTVGTDSFGEPTSLRALHDGLEKYEVEYLERDKLGRIVQKRETVLGVQGPVVKYLYDLAGRLVGVCEDGAKVREYVYDANSNRELAKTCAASSTCDLTPCTASSSVAGVFDAQDRMTGYGDLEYAYTYNGELTTKTLPGNPPLVTSYEYDVLGNLRHVELPDATEIDYLIDARNRRVGKKVDGVLVKGWLYQDQLEPVAELDGAGNVVSEFVYGSRAHVPDYMIQGGAMYRIVSDHLGSLRLVVRTSDGCVMQKMVHDEWGKVLLDQVCGEACCMGSGFVRVPFGFAGGLYDEQTGLVRFGARDYDPEAGRWTGKDPLFFYSGSVNTYDYCVTDPTSWIDPDGERIEYPDKPSRRFFEPVLKVISSTLVGKTLIDLLECSSQVFYLHLYPGMGLGGLAIINIIHIDPSSLPMIYTDHGWIQASITRAVVHELGHLAQQLVGEYYGNDHHGRNELPNIRDWENPIMVPLEGAKRLAY